ncbi:MAG: nucleotide exchange factor GrpE [Candidatus Omnitrophota bacterium]
MLIKKLSNDEILKRKIVRLLKKLKLESCRNKKINVYVNKVCEIFKLYDGEKLGLEKLYDYDDIVNFADYLESISGDLLGITRGKKNRPGNIGKMLIYLFVLLYSKKVSKGFSIYMGMVFPELAQVPKLKQNQIKHAIELILVLSEFQIELNEKYKKIDNFSVELFSEMAGKSLRFIIEYFIQNNSFEDWKKYFTIKEKNCICEKNFRRLKFILNLLATGALLQQKHYGLLGSEAQKPVEYFSNVALLARSILELKDINSASILYHSVHDAIANHRVSVENIAELATLCIGGPEREPVRQILRIYFNSKEKTFLSQVFMPVVSGELKMDVFLNFFGDTLLCHSILKAEVLQDLLSYLEEKGICNEYYDYLCNLLGKQPKSLSNNIGMILKDSCSDEEKNRKLFMIKGNRNIMNFLAIFQESECKNYDDHFSNTYLVRWLANQLLNDFIEPSSDFKNLILDKNILKVFKETIKIKSMEATELIKANIQKDTEVQDKSRTIGCLSKELEALKFKNNEISKENNNYVELLKQFEEKLNMQENRYREDLEALKKSYRINENRNSEAARHALLMRLIRISDRFNAMKNDKANINLSSIMVLLDEELANENIESFGEIGEEIVFDEKIHTPVEVSRSEYYLGKYVVILERGYILKSGEVIKKAIVKPL